jgi:hypothetical protein
MRASPVKKSAEDYLSWAGWFVDPVADPEIFKRLPGWWQRERTLRREAAAAGRELTQAEIDRARGADTSKLIAIHLPEDLTLAALLMHEVGPCPDELIVALRDKLTPDMVIQHCTTLGEGRSLTQKRPQAGLYSFLWLVARFRKQQLPSVPITAYWELEEGIEELTGIHASLLGDDPITQAVFTLLDGHVSRLTNMVA